MASLEEKLNLKEECDKALSSKNNYSFKDLCSLAEMAGFKLEMTRKKKGGSHVVIYKHPAYEIFQGGHFNDMMNFQPNPKKKSKSKPAQVRQLIDFLRNANPKQGE